MSDWVFLNKHRLRHGVYGSDDSYGFNGAFGFHLPDEARMITCICSDQEGWQHVSVSFGSASHRTPKWSTMDAVKRLFWEPTDWVVQFHPPVSDHINVHPGCLHLWRCIDGREQPIPPKAFV